VVFLEESISANVIIYHSFFRKDLYKWKPDLSALKSGLQEEDPPY
jgi:hypothetical protein